MNPLSDLMRPAYESNSFEINHNINRKQKSKILANLDTHYFKSKV
jgi:hypothetical protein